MLTHVEKLCEYVMRVLYWIWFWLWIFTYKY